MPFRPADKRAWIELLDTVIAIPTVPYRAGRIDLDGHRTNLDYLLAGNTLEGGRVRFVSIAGTSPLHHIDPDDQVRLLDETGRRCGDKAGVIAGLLPNPLGEAARLVEREAALPRPPDAYLLMPLAGIAHPDGVYDAYLAFGERLGQSCGARFLLYYQNRRHREAMIRLVRDSPHFVGVKVGTDVDDVGPLVDSIGGRGAVVWGIGDRCAEAARRGARGHTSGIAILCARLSDAINNAVRRQDWDEARRLEGLAGPLEDIRFQDDRIYNYSAVVAALRLSGCADVAGGDGAPFNPLPPAAVQERVRQAIQPLLAYH